jgi:hypothetical protein
VDAAHDGEQGRGGGGGREGRGNAVQEQLILIFGM